MTQKRFASRLGWLLTFLLVAAMAAAQGGFEKGYYITTSGNRVEAYLQKPFPVRNAEVLLFRNDPLSGQSSSAFLSDLAEAGYDNGERYVVFRGILNNQQAQIWLRQLAGGPVELFVANIDGSGEVFFLREGQGELSPVRRNTFSGVVATMRKNCPDLSVRSDAPYSQKTLTILVEQYTSCKYPGAPTAVKAKPPAFSWDIGAKAGMAFGNMKPLQGSYYYYGDYSGFAAPIGGLSLRFNASRRFSALLDVNYLRNNASSDYVNVPPISQDSTYSVVDIDLNYLQVPIAVQYRFLTGKLKAFGEVGIAGALPLKRTIQEDLFLAFPTSTSVKPENGFVQAYFAAFAGAGLGFPIGKGKEFMLGARFTAANDFFKILNYTFSSTDLVTNLQIRQVEVNARLLFKLGR